MLIRIVIVNFRTSDLVRQCLESIRADPSSNGTHVVVVDNASGEGSAERIDEWIRAEGWTDWVSLVRSDVNGGFSAGNNVGIKQFDAEAFLLLNSDTFVKPRAIATLREALKKNSDVGIVAPRLEWPDGTPQVSCFRWPQPCAELIRSAASGPITRLLRHAEVPLPIADFANVEPEWVSFAAVMIRREVIQQVGLMDDRYFMYFEDIDYCRRTRESGWRIMYCPEARIVHLRGGSSPVKLLSRKRARRPAYFYASRARYFAKFHGVMGLWRANVYWMIGRGVSLFREMLQDRPKVACASEWRDIWTNAWRPLSSDRDSKATSHSDHAT